jgi:hypothetical protein
VKISAALELFSRSFAIDAKVDIKKIDNSMLFTQGGFEIVNAKVINKERGLSLKLAILKHIFHPK